MKKIKDKILYCLEKYPEARNSDVKLTNAIWVEFYPNRLKFEEDQYWVKLTDLYDLPNQDDVKRIRAKIQNEKHMFLPTDPEVCKRRRINEEVWRKELGYNPELRKV